MPNIQFQVRRGTASTWTSTNPTLANGEFGFETDTRQLKIGNNVAWNVLPYLNIGQAANWSAFPAYQTVDMSANILNNVGSIRNGAGTVSAPSYTFLNDLSMGLYDPSTNMLGIVTLGVERMRITSGGDIGISTTPSYLAWGFGTANTTGFYSPSTNVLHFLTSASNRMTILANGNVGINNSGPAATLDVIGTTQSSRFRTYSNSLSLGNGSTVSYNWKDFFPFAGVGILKVVAWSVDDGGSAFAMREYVMRAIDNTLLQTLQNVGTSPGISQSGSNIVITNNLGSTRTIATIFHLIA